MSKVSYRVKNWNSYNQGLVRRGDLTLLIDESVVRCWQSPEVSKQRGRPSRYHQDAILTCLIIRYAIGLPYRQTEGFICSIFKLMGVDLIARDYSYLCKCANSMALKESEIASANTIAIDSSGFKIAGEGEWLVRTHGKKKRRKWLKLHIAVDVESRIITANVLTPSNTHDARVFEQLVPENIKTILADGAYDSQAIHDKATSAKAHAIVPPRTNSVLGPTPLDGEDESPRDQLILIQDLLGADWSKALGYNMRVHVEGAFSRIKRIFGDKIRSKGTQRQINEMLTKIALLNQFTRIGMPVAVPVN